MSNNFFPVLAGIAWDNVRTPVWQTRRQQSVSGKVTAMADWSSPVYKWQLTYDFLRSSPNHAELQAMVAFFNGVSGGFDTFLYVDPDDNAVTQQAIGVGDGSATTFGLARSFGGYTEPVWSSSLQAFVGGVATGCNVSPDLSSITFGTPPASGASVTVTMSYAWRCRFTDDTIDFSNFMSQLYQVRQLNFESVK